MTYISTVEAETIRCTMSRDRGTQLIPYVLLAATKVTS